MIKVSQAFSFSEIGKRENNEDFVGHKNQNCFVVCDGVGGNEKGEVASSLVGKCFLHEFEKLPDSDPSKVLKKAEAELSSYILNHPETQGMATTLTFSQIRNYGIYVAWCGDSRIYQFRDGKIAFQTEDHSWVNEAVKAGIISKGEAKGHPKSNIITRAICSEARPTQLDSLLIQNIEVSDSFLHCTDGVLEAWSNTDLEALFGQGFSPAQIIDRLQEECKNLSRDNATALLYQVEWVEGLPETDGLSSAHKVSAILKKLSVRKYIAICLAILLFVLIGLLILRKNKAETIGCSRDVETKSKKEKVIIPRKAIAKSIVGSLTNDTIEAQIARERHGPFMQDTINSKKAKSIKP